MKDGVPTNDLRDRALPGVGSVKMLETPKSQIKTVPSSCDLSVSQSKAQRTYIDQQVGRFDVAMHPIVGMEVRNS